MTNQSPTELEHYGVKGMKWGVRKERELVGRKRRGKMQDPVDQKQFAASQNRKRINARKVAAAAAVTAVAGLSAYALVKQYGKNKAARQFADNLLQTRSSIQKSVADRIKDLDGSGMTNYEFSIDRLVPGTNTHVKSMVIRRGNYLIRDGHSYTYRNGQWVW